MCRRLLLRTESNAGRHTECACYFPAVHTQAARDTAWLAFTASCFRWIYRRRFPLASYGWFAFLILLAPTSSFVPIRDPMAERRLYLPFIGLLFITVEFLRRWKTRRNYADRARSVWCWWSKAR